jgi:acetyl esterase/lipase
MPPPPALKADIHALRARHQKATHTLIQTIPNITAALSVEDRQIPTRDGSKITVRIYTPHKEVQGGHPLLVIFHGGGFCIGGLETEEMNSRLYCKELGFVVVNVDYRLAPEHPFPTPVNDAWDAVKWVSRSLRA